MGEGHDKRRSDGGELPNRAAPSRVAGDSGSAAKWSRDSARYVSGKNRSRDVLPDEAGGYAALPDTPGVRPIHVGLIGGFALLAVCICALVVFVVNAGSQSATASADGESSSAAAPGRSVAALEASDVAEAPGSEGASGAARPSGSSNAADASGSSGASSSSATSSASGSSASSSASSPAAPLAILDIDPFTVLGIPESSSVIAIDLSQNNVATGDPKGDLSGVLSAIEGIQENGGCGFVFIDMNTGRGLAYNAAQAMYIASASKAPLAYYALQNGAYANGYETGNIEEAIVYSDNDAYEAFGYNYQDGNYISWLAERGVYHEDYGDLYPLMPARSLASIWVEILRYIQGGSEEALWFASLLASTEVSFIYDGLADTGATVLNKGGWIADWDCDSVTDSAIVQIDGRTFVMTIVTDQPDDENPEQEVAALARALFGLRDKL